MIERPSLIHRRTFLRGLFAAPAIVAVSSIMPIRVFEDSTLIDANLLLTQGVVMIRKIGVNEWSIVGPAEVMMAKGHILRRSSWDTVEVVIEGEPVFSY